jgi:hypothetical protein
MFKAASVSSPDGGRTCFWVRKKWAKEKTDRAKGDPLSDSGALQDSGDRRNGLGRHFLGKQPVPTAQIILELAGV